MIYQKKILLKVKLWLHRWRVIFPGCHYMVVLKELITYVTTVYFFSSSFFLVYDHTGPICDISTNASSILYSHNVMFSACAVSVCHMVLLLLHVEHFINFYFIPIDLLARLSLNVSLLQSPIASCCLSVGKLKRTY